MSVKVTVQTRINPKLIEKLEKIGNLLDKETAKAVGESVVEDMLAFISSGRSPIKGNGNFPAYKNPDKYPGKRKPKTPVNLKLSGDFLDSLHYTTRRSEGKYEVAVGYPSREADKEVGHREGANKQPKRPTLPQKRERFAQQIEDAYIKIIRERISKLSKG